jgi:hypothetical protein
MLLLRMRVKTLCNIRSSANPSGGMVAEATFHPGPADGVGLVDDDRGKYSSFGGPQAAPAKGEG